MNLSRRTALILSLTSILGLGGMAVVSGVVLDDAFSDLEQEDAERDLDRVEAAVQSDLDDLAWSATQLSDLGSLILGEEFAADLNRSAGLLASLLAAGDLDAIAFGTPDGNWSAFAFDLDAIASGSLEQGFQNATPGLVTALAASDAGNAAPLAPHSSFLRVDEAVYLAGARALTDLDGNVTFVVAALRLVDDDYLEDLSNTTQLDVDAGPRDGAPPRELERDGFGTWTATRSLPADAPVLDLRVTGERDIYQQGLLSFLFVVGGAALISALLLAASLLAMRATVTGRLHALADRVAAVRSEGDLSARVGIAGHDELADLSHEFDLMLADLEGRSNELQRSNEELGAFASVVSHDLKSPLSTFSMNLAVMKRIAEREGDPKQLERIARMERTVVTMQGRIEAVLEYSRAGRKPKKNVVPLDDLARTVLEDVEANLVEASAEVELAPLPSVRGDRQALAQVLQNLIQNAVKYRREDVAPRLRVYSEAAHGGWNVVVQDNGRGFKPEDAEKMLQPFQRLDNVGDQSGHGVGLATCQRIMQVHDGALRAEGEEGVGAKMTMWFPKQRVLAPPTAARTTNTGEFTRAAEERARRARVKQEREAQERSAALEAQEAEQKAEQEEGAEEAFAVVDEAPGPEPGPESVPEPEPRARRELPPRPEWLVRAEAEADAVVAAQESAEVRESSEEPEPAAEPEPAEDGSDERFQRLRHEAAHAHAPVLEASASEATTAGAEGGEGSGGTGGSGGSADWRAELEARFGPPRPGRRYRRPADDGDDGDEPPEEEEDA